MNASSSVIAPSRFSTAMLLDPAAGGELVDSACPNAVGNARRSGNSSLGSSGGGGVGSRGGGEGSLFFLTGYFLSSDSVEKGKFSFVSFGLLSRSNEFKAPLGAGCA